MSWDRLIKIDDCNAVNGEGTLASVDDTVEDGFDVAGIGGLVVGCRGFDGEAETTNRRVIWGRVQTRPSVRRRVWVWESAVELVIMSMRAVVSVEGICRVEDRGGVVGRKSL